MRTKNAFQAAISGAALLGGIDIAATHDYPPHKVFLSMNYV
ncbi:hypothetical protein AAIB41_15495 [Brucella sp. BE17]